jgi:hypothetical protein
MEKRLCLTSFLIGLPIRGAGGLCLLDGFALSSLISWTSNLKPMISLLAKGHDHSSIQDYN